MRIWLMGCLMLLWGACSSDGTPTVDHGTDLKRIDLGQPDLVKPDAGPPLDMAPPDHAVADTHADSGPVTCVAGGTECNGSSLSCECCGSIGPKTICLCSKKCSVDTQCQGSGLPSCNMAQGQDSGICTPQGFNCCWLCN